MLAKVLASMAGGATPPLTLNSALSPSVCAVGKKPWLQATCRKQTPFSLKADKAIEELSLVAGAINSATQQNGRHERMHLTLKKEATRPPGMNSLQQQARFDDFVHEFNAERPHEAIAMKCPAEVYTPSGRPYQGLPDLDYPFHDRDVLVTACGRICIYRKKINVSTVLAGQRLGIKEVDALLAVWSLGNLIVDA